MSKMGEELGRRLDENKYEMYQACQTFNELHSAFNTMLGIRASDESIIEMLDREMDKLGASVGQVLSKVDK